MGLNLDRPERWKADIAESVDMYNQWFMQFAPQAFRDTRVKTTKAVEAALRDSGNLTDIRASVIREHPEILPTLRMSTCPPLAVDRLIGLAGVSPNLVKCMELEQKIPPRCPTATVDRELTKIAVIIKKMVSL
ncbi:MAG: XamI family restriction endonuclease [Deltaproteobacteria bacterium]|nr:XamI family restriction endonuclease [Deltaproteobacteria bacterium]